MKRAPGRAGREGWPSAWPRREARTSRPRSSPATPRTTSTSVVRARPSCSPLPRSCCCPSKASSTSTLTPASRQKYMPRASHAFLARPTRESRVRELLERIALRHVGRVDGERRMAAPLASATKVSGPDGQPRTRCPRGDGRSNANLSSWSCSVRGRTPLIAWASFSRQSRADQKEHLPKIGDASRAAFDQGPAHRGDRGDSHGDAKEPPPILAD
jgi:hypothetical protein